VVRGRGRLRRKGRKKGEKEEETKRENIFYHLLFYTRATETLFSESF
jgi:hypothetical protein